MTTQTFLRLTAWILFGAIVVVTLGPLNIRPRSDLPVSVERIAAFSLVGLTFALAYPRRIWWAAAFVLLSAIGLEALQHLTSDRHGRELDALAKLAGAALGLTLGWLATRFRRQHQSASD